MKYTYGFLSFLNITIRGCRTGKDFTKWKKNSPNYDNFFVDVFGVDILQSG